MVSCVIFYSVILSIERGIPYRVSVQSQNVTGCGLTNGVDCFFLEGGLSIIIMQNKSLEGNFAGGTINLRENNVLALVDLQLL